MKGKSRPVVVLLGGPGAGKGTQAEVISDWLRIPVISTGQMLRSAIAQETGLGKRAKALVEAGRLVDAAIINALVSNRIWMADCRDGFILDGYPRNLPQALALGRQLKAGDRLIVIDVDTDLERIVERLTRRLICGGCDATYKSMISPPASGVCDRCGTLLNRRPDDDEHVIRLRFATYRRETLPVMEFYKKSGVYHAVDGMRTPGEVAEAIAAILRNETLVSHSRHRPNTGNPEGSPSSGGERTPSQESAFPQKILSR